MTEVMLPKDELHRCVRFGAAMLTASLPAGCYLALTYFYPDGHVVFSTNVTNKQDAIAAMKTALRALESEES